MEQRAGVATFHLPEGWIDHSTYIYTSPDRLWKITLIFDSEVEEATAEAAMQDRLETARDVLPGFRIEQPLAATQLAGVEAYVVTFSNQDADGVTRTRLLIAMLAPRRAIVVHGQGPANRWAEFEPVWGTFMSHFVLSHSPAMTLPTGGDTR
jgi:hypothetical protein